MSGGAIYSKSSTVDIHNCKVEDNVAGGKGKFAMISSKSKLKANYLTLIDIKRKREYKFNIVRFYSLKDVLPTKDFSLNGTKIQ